MNEIMRRIFAVSATTLAFVPAYAGLPSTVTKQVLDSVEAAAIRSGKTFESRAAKEAAVSQAGNLASKHGSGVLKVMEDGGLEMMEVVPKYGDDLLKIATQASPQGRRVLAMNAAELAPLAKRVGVDAVELEAKAPGQAIHAFQIFGDETGKVVAKSVKAEDLPRFIKYGEKADSEKTRGMLLEAYKKEGASLFARIPPKQILAYGLSASMILGTYEVTAPDRAKADVLRDNPEIARDVMNYSTLIWGIVVLILGCLLLWRIGVFQSARKRE